MTTNLNPKRLILLALAPGALVLGGDAAIAHFAGREMAHPAQLLPVTLGPLAALILMLGAWREEWLRRAVQVGGALLLALGGAGTAFHARALMRLLQGAPLTWENVTTALAVAPPIFAPGAFALVGALVLAAGNPRVRIELQPA
jgi:hypothetical protein